MPASVKPEHELLQFQSILKLAEEFDERLRREPMPVHIGVVNILQQTCLYREAMIRREEEKEAKNEKLAKEFGPHRKQ